MKKSCANASGRSNREKQGSSIGKKRRLTYAVELREDSTSCPRRGTIYSPGFDFMSDKLAVSAAIFANASWRISIRWRFTEVFMAIFLDITAV